MTDQQDQSADALDKLLSKVPPEKVENLKKRRASWQERNIKLFRDNPRFTTIKSSMMDGAAFSAMTVDGLCSDMAFLAAFYDHIVELEGIAFAGKILYSKYYADNIAILSFADVYKGNKAEVEAQIIRQIPSMKDLWDFIVDSEYELSLLGLAKDQQTSRSDSIKMMIEVYKKRHDSKVKAYDAAKTR